MNARIIAPRRNDLIPRKGIETFQFFLQLFNNFLGSRNDLIPRKGIETALLRRVADQILKVATT